ncbi:LuxR C-terminal-related transcriptional regulator [Citrobacter koseri]|uniref:LuxR C-terminal-related transcriptional regulator n=1 Tax=Citrobacter koseri TaxID=545 RepID=UPI003891F694
MIKFTIILSKCNFSSVGLLNILTGIYGNENIVSFSKLNELYEWRKKVSVEVSLKLYIIMPAVFSDVQGFDCLISSSDTLEKAGVSDVIILNESELLPELFISICSCYGWIIANIYKLSCKDITSEIVFIEKEKKENKRRDIMLTYREHLVLGYLLKGLTVCEINKLIDVKMKTTYTFCSNLKRKLGVISTCKVYDYRNIINKAIKNGIIRLK